MIRVTDIQDGHVGVLSTFRVDASRAGEGQLEISINDGDVPNAVQVLGGGKCLVTYTPEEAITHEIEVTFNDEQVSGSPFLCRVNDGGSDIVGSHASYGSGTGTSKVTLDLEHLGLIPVAVPSQFTIRVAGGDDAELAVSVQGPTEDIPVKVTGNVKSGFTAEFLPSEVGIHMILVEYNGMAVGGTPFYSKAYDSENVMVSDITKANSSSQGLQHNAAKTVTFAGSSRY
jgi:filamin